MTKDERQQEIAAKWIALSGRGTCEAVTGFGKTRLALILIQRMLAKDNTRTTLVVVPSKKLADDWLNKTTGHIVKWGLKGVTVLVINTLIKQPYLKCDLLVLDEIHNYAATEFSKVFSIVSYRWILGLTATLDRKDGKDIIVRTYAPVFDTVNMREAADNGYISKFLTFNLSVGLSPVEQKIYDEATQTMNSTFARFEHNFNLAKGCMAGGEPGKLLRESYAKQQGWTPADGDNHSFSPKSLVRYAIQWNRSIATRKKLLYQSSSKQLIVAKLLTQFSSLKAITFSESVDFADRLAGLFATTSRSYHSNKQSITESYEKVTMYKNKAPKIEKKTRRVSGSMLNKRALEEFNDVNSPVRILHTARALDEGFDVEDIELAIIASSTSAPRQNIQRTGRAVRFVADKLAIIINLYHPSTQDEKWLKDRQSTTRRAIWIDSIEQLLETLRDVQSNPAS